MSPMPWKMIASAAALLLAVCAGCENGAETGRSTNAEGTEALVADRVAGKGLTLAAWMRPGTQVRACRVVSVDRFSDLLAEPRICVEFVTVALEDVETRDRIECTLSLGQDNAAHLARWIKKEMLVDALIQSAPDSNTREVIGILPRTNAGDDTRDRAK